MPAVSFGYKCAWLAINATDPQTVLEALQLQEVRHASWAQGIEAAYRCSQPIAKADEPQVFVAPPIDGWVLCVSAGFFRYVESGPEEFTRLIVDLSRKLNTSVQCFATHRVVELHAWGWAHHGELIRAYGYLGEAGETLFDLGVKTKEEIEPGLQLFDGQSPQAESESYWEPQDLTFPTEETVMQVAGKWSVDPTLLEEREIDPGDGWLGSLPG